MLKKLLIYQLSSKKLQELQDYLNNNLQKNIYNILLMKQNTQSSLCQKKITNDNYV